MIHDRFQRKPRQFKIVKTRLVHLNNGPTSKPNFKKRLKRDVPTINQIVDACAQYVGEQHMEED